MPRIDPPRWRISVSVLKRDKKTSSPSGIPAFATPSPNYALRASLGRQEDLRQVGPVRFAPGLVVTTFLGSGYKNQHQKSL